MFQILIYSPNRFDFHAKREENAVLTGGTYHMKSAIKKTMNVKGKNKDDDDVEVRAEDERKLEFPSPFTKIVAPFSYLEMVFNEGRSEHKTMKVYVNKKK